MAVDDITARAHDNSNDGSTRGGGGEADRLGPGIPIFASARAAISAIVAASNPRSWNTAAAA